MPLLLKKVNSLLAYNILPVFLRIFKNLMLKYSTLSNKQKSSYCQ